MSNNIKSLLSYIELLTSKQPCNKESNDKFSCLELELKARIQSVFKKLQLDEDLCQQIEKFSPALLIPITNDEQFEIRWTFIEWLLVLLVLLKEILDISSNQASSYHENVEKQPIPPSGMLSISQEKTVLTAVQFIVALGIAPSLLQGVGIPLQKRCELDVHFQEPQESILPQQKHRRLVASTVIILHCIKQSALGSIILTYHFIDLLSALCQLCYAPIRKTLTKSQVKQSMLMESSENETKFTENVESRDASPVPVLLRRVRDAMELSQEQLIKEMWEDRKYLTLELEKLIRRSYKPLLISTLFQLQASGFCYQQKNKPSTSQLPKWMSQACGILLTKELIQPRGVYSVIEGILLLAGTEDEKEGSEKWGKYEAIGKIIAHVPHCSPSADAYFKTICPQLLSLLQTKGTKVNRIVHWISICSISSMMEHKPELTEKYIFDPLLKPLRSCLGTPDYPSCSESHGTILATEKQLTLNIENLHKIVLCDFNLSPLVRSKLMCVFIPLFHLLCFTQEGVFHLRQKVEDIVITLLKSSDDPAQFLLNALFDIYLPEEFRSMKTGVRFEYGEEACIKIVKKEFSRFSSEDFVSENIKRCSCGIYLLQSLNDKKLIGKVFFSLLKELQKILEGSEIEDKDIKSASALLEVKTENDLQLIKLHKNLLLLQLIQDIAEQFDETIIEDSSQSIEFIQTTLDRCIHFCKAEDSHLGTETIALVLGALAMLVSQKDKLKPEDWTRLKNCIPSLQSVIHNFHDDIKTTAQELVTIIATHGAAGWDRLGLQSDKQGNSSRKKLEKKNVLLTEICNNTTTDRNVKDNVKSNNICPNAKAKISDHQNLTPENVDTAKISTYQVVLEELNDVLLPVRGHALIELKKLILSRDPETLQNSDKLIEILTEFLSDTDSYIFLPTIHCLSALGTIYADKVVPVLAAQFIHVDRSRDLKIKIAEALMYIIRALGELNPKYRDILLPLFLGGTKDADPQLRASSLSNLGEICQQLKYSIGPYLQEILMCVQSFLRTDSSVEVRRAAVLTLSLLLRGLGNDSLKVLEEEIRDLYRLLKLCYINESDDVVKLHVQIALEEIRIFIKETFCSQQPLIKEIKVLHP